MTYHTKTTGLASVAALAVGALLAFAPMKAEAATVLSPTPVNVGGGVVKYDINDTGGTTALDGDDYELGFDINIMDATETQFNFSVFGSGTLSIDLFADPFAPGGVGTADVRLTSLQPAFAAGAMYEATWGNGPTVSLVDGEEKIISTSFSSAGEVQTLFFEWSGVSKIPRQTTAGVSAVPLPASALLLLGGLGGLGGVSALRRRKRAA